MREREKDCGVPILYDFWIGKEVFHGDEARWKQWLEQYPRDIDTVFFRYAGKYGRACGRSGLLLGGSRQENRWKEKRWTLNV